MRVYALCVLCVSFICSKVAAMETEVVKPAPETNGKMVAGVALQVKPAYIPGTNIFARVSAEDAKRHELKFSQICTEVEKVTGNRVTSVQPVANFGIYYMHFQKPVHLATLAQLFTQLPGFERIHDMEDYEAEESAKKRAILKLREAQLNNTARLCAFHKLSQSQKLFAKVEQETLAAK